MYNLMLFPFWNEGKCEIKKRKEKKNKMCLWKPCQIPRDCKLKVKVLPFVGLSVWRIYTKKKNLEVHIINWQRSEVNCLYGIRPSLMLQRTITAKEILTVFPILSFITPTDILCIKKSYEHSYSCGHVKDKETET